MKRKCVYILMSIIFLTLTGCNYSVENKKNEPVNSSKNSTKPLKVGLLVEGKIVDQTWESQAYKGLRKIRELYNAEITFKEGMNTEAKREKETEQMAKEGYDLIFGNGFMFQKAFNKIAAKYPKTHFVFFYADPVGENVTSFYFNPKSLGYFSGMIAGLCTKTNKIGLIPAYDYLEEISYFIRGAKDANPKSEVLVEVVNSWDDKVKAGEYAQKMIDEGVDILAPMGDGYNIEVIMRAWKAKIYAVGYVFDSSFMAKDTVLTSVNQNLMTTYVHIAEKFVNNKLPSGKHTLDFHDGSESISPYGNMVTKDVQEKVNKRLKEYIDGSFVLPVLPLKWY